MYKILHADIGTKSNIPHWPTNDLDGLFDALERWSLDPRAQMSGDDPGHPHVAFEAPFRCLAWGDCFEEPIPGTNGLKKRFVGTKPIYEGHPTAVSFCGNFLDYSFAFNVITDDPELIAELDRRIAVNMARMATKTGED